MKCDQALEALATGGFVRRWLAARHSARCSKCSGQAEALRRIVEVLSDVPPLTESDRQGWMKAADEARVVRESPGWHALAKREHGSTRIHAHASREHATRRILWRNVVVNVLGVLLAVLIFIGLTYLQKLEKGLRKRPIVAVVISPVVLKQTTLRDLDALQGQTSMLSRELDDLLREVDLLDARRDVEALQLRFVSVGERHGP